MRSVSGRDTFIHGHAGGTGQTRWEDRRLSVYLNLHHSLLHCKILQNLFCIFHFLQLTGWRKMCYPLCTIHETFHHLFLPGRDINLRFFFSLFSIFFSLLSMKRFMIFRLHAASLIKGPLHSLCAADESSGPLRPGLLSPAWRIDHLSRGCKSGWEPPDST